MTNSQLFVPGEFCILRSTDSDDYLWDARVTVTSAKWVEDPRDIHGSPYPATWVYTINIIEGYFVQAALKKIEVAEIKSDIAKSVTEIVEILT